MLAHVGGEVQWQGEGLWVQMYFGARGAKACKQGGYMGGGSEGRRVWMAICVLRDGAQQDVCVHAAGRQHGRRAGTYAKFEEGACSRPACRQARGPAPFFSPAQAGWSASKTCSWSLIASFNVHFFPICFLFLTNVSHLPLDIINFSTMRGASSSLQRVKKRKKNRHEDNMSVVLN